MLNTIKNSMMRLHCISGIGCAGGVDICFNLCELLVRGNIFARSFTIADVGFYDRAMWEVVIDGSLGISSNFVSQFLTLCFDKHGNLYYNRTYVL